MFLIDGHVHLHACFDVVASLNAAHQNFSAVAQQAFVGVLCLAELPGERVFERMREHRVLREEWGESGWTVCPTGEACSLQLRQADGKELLVVAGRQNVTRENLEVLALGTCRSFQQGLSIEAMLWEVTEAGAVPVVPWGFGKWMGRRGRIVRDLLQKPGLPPFFLGDNANRPAFWGMPSLFAEAETRGIRNLPGSDPLPFPVEYRGIGRAGIKGEGRIDKEHPAQFLKALLQQGVGKLEPYGQGETLGRFVRHQLGMQVIKRKASLKSTA